MAVALSKVQADDELRGVHRRPRGRAIEGHGPTAGAIEHEMTGDPDPKTVRVQARRPTAAGRGFFCGQASRLQNGRRGDHGVAGRPGDPPPVGVLAVGRGLDQAGTDDRARDRPSRGVVAGPRHPGREQDRGALTIRRLLAGEVAGHGLQGGPQRNGSLRPRGDQQRGRGSGCEHEDRVVGAGVAIDRELIPGAHGDGPQQAP